MNTKKKTTPPWLLAIPLGATIVTAALYFLFLKIPLDWLAALAVILIWLIVGAFYLGFWMGKVEVRGVLAGLDRGMEKYFAFREEHSKRVPQNVNPTLNISMPPQYPQISHRQDNSVDGQWKEY